jgi:hypothetical protein
MKATNCGLERTETVRAPTRERDALLATKRVVARVNMAINVVVVAAHVKSGTSAFCVVSWQVGITVWLRPTAETVET